MKVVISLSKVDLRPVPHHLMTMLQVSTADNTMTHSSMSGCAEYVQMLTTVS